METTQVLLVVVIIALTVLLVAIGIQVFMVIVDLRRAIKRLNGILEDSVLGGGLIRPEKLTKIWEIFKRRNVSDTRSKGGD